MPLITIGRAAQISGFSTTWLYELIARGELHKQTDAEVVLLEREEVERLAQRGKSKGGRPRDPNSRRSRAAAQPSG